MKLILLNKYLSKSNQNSIHYLVWSLHVLRILISALAMYIAALALASTSTSDHLSTWLHITHFYSAWMCITLASNLQALALRADCWGLKILDLSTSQQIYKTGKEERGIHKSEQFVNSNLNHLSRKQLFIDPIQKFHSSLLNYLSSMVRSKVQRLIYEPL